VASEKLKKEISKLSKKIRVITQSTEEFDDKIEALDKDVDTRLSA